jgi:Uncharacterised methyltransferase family (DUF6094)
MRLAAQLRGGFYPAPPQAVAYAATFLNPPRHGPFTLLDPCAGEGAALLQLGERLGCPPALRFAIELDDGRAEKVHAALPGAHVLAPASFFGCRASRNSFSLVWLNPPFDDAYGGHRVEAQFLRTATEWLMPGGVMASFVRRTWPTTILKRAIIRRLLRELPHRVLPQEAQEIQRSGRVWPEEDQAVQGPGRLDIPGGRPGSQGLRLPDPSWPRPTHLPEGRADRIGIATSAGLFALACPTDDNAGGPLAIAAPGSGHRPCSPASGQRPA